ncbi:Imm5 family immunity protein [Bacteroides acidifaciens]|uniref:Imm5 family immunity protein n=1 Tax=Bacteroides acidifaciens TaxID=85831 RepID=UPI002557F0E7|nr:Imm5 family immunity protein [Bacteroides acidifaciens]
MEQRITSLETITSLISKGLDEVNHSSTGHLSLSTRRKILQTINEPCIIGRISILCALKVYPIWNDFFRNDTEIIGLIEKTEKYLLGQTCKKDLLNDANSIISDYDSDEEVEDPYEWDTAFLASLVYNGGIVDLDFIDDERNKEFWSWYLTDCIKTACSDDRLPYPASTSKVTPSAKYIPYRTQLNLWKDDEKCCAYVNSIKEILAKMVAYAQWSKCDFYCYTVENTSYTKIYYYRGNEPVQFRLGINVTIHLSGKIETLKDLMYSLCPQEGAFYLCKITIDKGNNMDIRFGYDTRYEELKKAFSDSDFSEDFSKYPRAKKFIPDWLADILKRKRISF